MFELFKKRDLASFITDTISFFKLEGKTFFKNYFIINGPLLAVLVICMYLLGGSLFTDVFQNNTNLETLLGEDVAYSALWLILLIITSIIFSIIAYTFPILYLQNMANGIEHSSNTYLKQLKSVSGRAIVFALGSFFLIIPLLLICLFISVLLSFILIGIPLFIILSAFSISWTCVAYYEYTSNGTSFFNAYGKAFDTIKSSFWPIIGNTLIVYFIIQIITSIVSFLPQSYYYFKLFTSLNEGTSIESELSPLFITVMGISMIVSVLISFVSTNFLLVNQGLIYYSGKEKEKSFNAFNSIEEIGSNEE